MGGPGRVARLLVNLVRRGAGWGLRYEHAELDGDAGVVVLAGDSPAYASAFTLAEGRVHRIYVVVNPDKLAALRLGGPVE